MNTKTKDALDAFIGQIQAMAVGCSHMLGQNQVRLIIETGSELRNALECDETITETK